jgi:orotate phosphoribosyltransferase
MYRRTTGFTQTESDLAMMLWTSGAILTDEAEHPSLLTRKRPTGTERGFPSALHPHDPTAELAPFDFDLRTSDHPTKPGPLTPETVELAGRCMQDVAIRERCSWCHATAGTAWAGVPFAQTLARLYGSQCVAFDKYHTGRKYCTCRQHLPAGVRRVLMVDNVPTQATTLIDTLAVLRDAGAHVCDSMVLIDRECGARERLLDWNCTLHAVFTASDLFHFYRQAGVVSPLWNWRAQHYIRSNSLH